jgi:hypothetical protein
MHETQRERAEFVQSVGQDSRLSSKDRKEKIREFDEKKRRRPQMLYIG